MSGPDGVGLKTAFGSLVVAKDGRGRRGQDGGEALAPPARSTEATGHAGITMKVSGSKTGPGANGRRPCLVNGGWAPPYT